MLPQKSCNDCMQDLHCADLSESRAIRQATQRAIQTAYANLWERSRNVRQLCIKSHPWKENFAVFVVAQCVLPALLVRADPSVGGNWELRSECRRREQNRHTDQKSRGISIHLLLETLYYLIAPPAPAELSYVNSLLGVFLLQHEWRQAQSSLLTLPKMTRRSTRFKRRPYRGTVRTAYLGLPVVPYQAAESNPRRDEIQGWHKLATIARIEEKPTQVNSWPDDLHLRVVRSETEERYYPITIMKGPFAMMLAFIIGLEFLSAVVAGLTFFAMPSY